MHTTTSPKAGALATSNPRPVIDSALPLYRQLEVIGVPKAKCIELAVKLEGLHATLSGLDSEAIEALNTLGLRGALGLVEAQPGFRIIAELK